MKKKNNTLAGLTLVLATVTLAACGNGDNSQATPVEPPPQSAAQVERVAESSNTPEELGKKMFTRCRTCHTLEQDGRHRVGPNLWGIFGKTSGTAEGFAYSKAMTEAAIVWDDQSLSDYIESPKAFVPRGKMMFVGLKKQSDRDNLIAYLKAETQPK